MPSLLHPALQELRPELIQELAYNNSLNSKAFLIEHADLPIEFVGNRTECALLMLTKKWGVDYKQVCRHRLRCSCEYMCSVMQAASLHSSASHSFQGVKLWATGWSVRC
jgi:hypothetical protein